MGVEKYEKKLSKSAVDYVDRARSADHCATCEHFQKPTGCEIVFGTINAEGWCKRFEPDDGDGDQGRGLEADEGDHEYR